MTPSSAVLDRPEAPETSDIPSINVMLYRIMDTPAEPPIPTRDEVLQAMYDEGVTHQAAVEIYDMFAELTENLRLIQAGGSDAQMLQELPEEWFGENTRYVTFVILSRDDQRHPALLKVMKDDVLAEDGTEAHRMLEQHFEIGERYCFVHSFHQECVGGIARR